MEKKKNCLHIPLGDGLVLRLTFHCTTRVYVEHKEPLPPLSSDLGFRPAYIKHGDHVRPVEPEAPVSLPKWPRALSLRPDLDERRN